MKTKIMICLFAFAAIAGCKNSAKKQKSAKPAAIFNGLYSFGPEVKSFKECINGQEYWVADSSAKLELTYSQQNFEKPYEPVYVEVEGLKVKSGKEGAGAEFDSTLIVKKLIKLTREIPKDCN